MAWNYAQITDDLGYTWIWDGSRVYCLEAEQEMEAAGDDTSENGYYAATLEDAILVLQDSGYIGNAYLLQDFLNERLK